MLLQNRLLLVTSLLLFPLVATSQVNRPQPYEDTEAYQVYSAIIPPGWLVRIAKAKTLVIQAETDPGLRMCLEPDAESKKIIGTAIADYLKVNKKTWLIQKNIKLEMPYQIIDNEKVNSIFKNGSWNNFNNQYPDAKGYITLSAVGFNSEKTVAVVYSGWGCGIRCGGGEYHVLQKKDGKWIPLGWSGSNCAWRS
jgi:hypothetical protein